MRRIHTVVATALTSALCIVTLAPSPVAGQRKPTANPTIAPSAPRPSAPLCPIDANEIAAHQKGMVSRISAGLRAPSPPPKPQQTNAVRVLDASIRVQPAGPATLGGDISPQLCQSLKTGAVTPDEVTAMLGTMEKDHARKSHKKRKQIKKLGVSYTYEYTLDIGGLTFFQQPGVGYCSDFDWRFKVRNISQRDFTVFSTTGEVGLCASPGFGLFYIPGLATVMPFPVPGLCFDDARLTKLDLRNVKDEFEGELVDLVGLAFATLQEYRAKVCIIGSPYPPWFTPVVITPASMVVYCTSTRNCEIDAVKLAKAYATKKED
jgi:hypothetical protein